MVTQLAVVDTSPRRGGRFIGLAYVGGDQLAVGITLNTMAAWPGVAIWAVEEVTLTASL